MIWGADDSTIRHLAGVTVLATALAFSGCSTAPIVLDLQYQQSIEDRPAPRSQCRVAFQPVIDSRRNTETLGVLCKRTVQGNKPAAWVTEGLKATLTSPGFALVEAGPEADVTGTIELEKVYVQYVLANFETSVTLRTTLIAPGGARRSIIHRGSDVKTNWFNGDGEIMCSLNSSLNRALAALAKDVAEACDAVGGR